MQGQPQQANTGPQNSTPPSTLQSVWARYTAAHRRWLTIIQAIEGEEPVFGDPHARQWAENEIPTVSHPLGPAALPHLNLRPTHPLRHLLEHWVVPTNNQFATIMFSLQSLLNQHHLNTHHRRTPDPPATNQNPMQSTAQGATQTPQTASNSTSTTGLPSTAAPASTTTPSSNTTGTSHTPSMNPTTTHAAPGSTVFSNSSISHPPGPPTQASPAENLEYARTMHNIANDQAAQAREHAQRAQELANAASRLSAQAQSSPSSQRPSNTDAIPRSTLSTLSSSGQGPHSVPTPTASSSAASNPIFDHMMREWRSTIDRDVERQEEMEDQRPFSDAYSMNPLPSTAVSPSVVDQSDRILLENVLRFSEEQVSGQNRVLPLSANSEVVPALLPSFRQELARAITTRLQTDEDWAMLRRRDWGRLQERFPNLFRLLQLDPNAPDIR